MFKKLRAKIDNRLFLIEEDLPHIGWYLYVYENGKCIADHLQNDFDTIMVLAKEDYDVPTNQWEDHSS